MDKPDSMNLFRADIIRCTALLVLVSACATMPQAKAQAPISRQVEALGQAATQARAALVGWPPLSDSTVPHVVATERDLVGCAMGWRDLSLWRVTPSSRLGGDASVAVIRGILYPLEGLESSDLGGVVEALLLGGRTDGQVVTVDCLVETIVSMLAIPGEDISRTSAPMEGGRVAPLRTRLDDLLPLDWPQPDLKLSGGNTVVIFTIFYLNYTSKEILYRPVAYSLVFDPKLRLLSWAVRTGDPSPESKAG